MNKKIIKICHCTGLNLVNQNTKLPELIVYNNFIDLVYSPQLNHNKDEINRLFNSPLSFFICAILDGKIIGYLLGELKQLRELNPNDNRIVCFITYLYTVESYRGHGIASNLMDYMTKKFGKGISGCMLIFDTEDNELKFFYEKKGFMPDNIFRNYSRHDVYFKQFN